MFPECFRYIFTVDDTSALRYLPQRIWIYISTSDRLSQSPETQPLKKALLRGFVRKFIAAGTERLAANLPAKRAKSLRRNKQWVVI